MLADVGSPDTSGTISDPVVVIGDVARLSPPVVVPQFVSLVAPVVTTTVDDPTAVGVPETGQEMLAPAATVAGGTGVQAPTVTPAGSPLTEQVAAVALAVAVAEFVHRIVPV